MLKIRRGFTLLELLVVISIIILLAGLIMSQIWKAPRRAKIVKRRRS